MNIYTHLLETGWMPVRSLPAPPPPLEADPDRLAGMLWGLYLGDALGNASESQEPSTRRERHGEISTYAGQGRASDDSQLAFWTLEHLLEHGRIHPQKLARRFASEPVRGLGGTVRAFLQGVKEGLPWHECSVNSLGNGSLMRIAPTLAPFLRTPEQLYPNVAVAAALTHRSPGAVATCLAYVEMLRELLALPAPPPAGWYSARFLATLRACCPDEAFVNSLSDSVKTATERSIPVMELRSSAYLLETVPALLLLLDRYGHDPVQCVLRAVNDTYDNDSLGAMVGACVGALHGLARFPDAWLKNLEGRVSPRSRPVSEMILEATERWAHEERNWTLVRERLASLRVGPPLSHGALHLVPLFGPDLPVQADLLENARHFTLSEVGRVDTLQAHNQGRRPVLVLEGEAVIGGLQNRIFRSHVLVGASQRVDLPVCCVERGRWGAHRDIRAGQHLAPPSVRSGRSQAEVWDQVEGQLTRTRARTRTRSMHSAYARVGKLAVEPLRGQVGLLALLGERVLCLEVVGSAELYARIHRKLMASLALESHGLPGGPLEFSRRDAAEAFLDSVRTVGNTHRRAPLGLGTQLEFDAGGVRGQALVHEDQVLCLSAAPG